MKLLFIIFSAAVLSGCFKSEAEITASAETGDNTAEYFVFNSYPVKKISIPDDSGTLLPWTEQVRISDYAVAGQYLYLAVNNTGIMKIPLNNPSKDKFVLYENDSLVTENTMKSLFYFEKSIFCHLYRDSFFSENYSALSAVPLIKLSSSDNLIQAEFSDKNLPVKSEAVDFIYADDIWISAWKKSDRDSSSFSYFSHDIRGNNFSEISEADYRKKLAFNGNCENPDPSLLRLYNFIQTHSAEASMTDFLLRYSGCTAAENFRFLSTEEDPGSYLSVPVYKADGNYWFSADNKIYVLEGNNKISRIKTDPLPEGYRYTGICCEKGKIYLFWEYQSFFNTGNAGFSIIDEKRVDKITI